MSDMKLFLKTCIATMLIASVMITLFHIERTVRQSPKASSPTPPYVAVFSPVRHRNFDWWTGILNSIRFGN